MSNIDKHPAGAFCWVELGTTNQNAAKTFYSSVFAWAPDDSPMGPGEFYTMFKINGRNVGAAYTLRPEQVSQGVPPHWNLYVAVDSADEAAKRAAELGGKVLAPPFDVFDFGRMAVLQDPTGAVLSVWQAKQHAGIQIAGVEGTLCWADLNTPDIGSARTFYSNLFGWTIEAGKDSPYLHIQNGATYIGGIPPAEHLNPDAPPHWLAYFAASNCKTVTDKAKNLGAAVYLEPMTMEDVGTMSVLADPQGAVFAIFQDKNRG